VGPSAASAASWLARAHRQPHPDGPTAAWNLAARARRTHGLKHYGWTDVPTATGTLWTSPAGQLIVVDRYTPAPPWLDPGAELPDPDQLHQLDAELLREPPPGEPLTLPPPPITPARDDSPPTAPPVTPPQDRPAPF